MSHRWFYVVVVPETAGSQQRNPEDMDIHRVGVFISKVHKSGLTLFLSKMCQNFIAKRSVLYSMKTEENQRKFTDTNCVFMLFLISCQLLDGGPDGDLLQPFIAAKLHTLSEIFILGDEKTYNGYSNKRLQDQQEYRCFVLAELTGHQYVSSSGNKVWGLR